MPPERFFKYWRVSRSNSAVSVFAWRSYMPTATPAWRSELLPRWATPGCSLSAHLFQLLLQIRKLHARLEALVDGGGGLRDGAQFQGDFSLFRSKQPLQYPDLHPD